MADPPREFAHLGPHRNRILVLPCSTIMRSTSGFCRLVVISPTVSDPLRPTAGLHQSNVSILRPPPTGPLRLCPDKLLVRADRKGSTPRSLSRRRVASGRQPCQ